ncbi:UNVERIFIED_CONTAM: hypothetical protein Slati_0821000 [Sesamum latifolium]|uniref:Uncharacterized protein n=1 Tax=Sesamum latifolium TaxID=2727402 RepID=A0AAW2XLW9_9LAMI
MGSSIASSDKSSVHIVMEILVDQDPPEATSHCTDLGLSAPWSGLRRSLRQAAVAARRLLDEENIEDEGERESEGLEGDDGMIVGLGELEGEGSSPREEKEGQRAPRSPRDWGSCNLRDSYVDRLVSDFHIPPPFAIYTPLPLNRPLSPPDNCLSFFVAQLRSGLRFSIPSFYSDVSRLFQVPLNQLSPNFFGILVGFFIIFSFRRFPVTANVFAQCFRLRMAEPGLFLFTPRPRVSVLPAPSAPKNWKMSFIFVWRVSPWCFPHSWIEDLPPHRCLLRKGVMNCTSYWRV